MEQDKYLKNIERVRAWMQENDAGALGVVIDGMVNLSLKRMRNVRLIGSHFAHLGRIFLIPS